MRATYPSQAADFIGASNSANDVLRRRFLLCSGVDLKTGHSGLPNMDNIPYLSQNAFEGD
jgi:hypothetical protein